MKRLLMIVTSIVTLMSLNVYSQEVSVKKSSKAPVIDGSVSEKEYTAFFDTKKGLKIYISYDDKNIYFGLIGDTKGWVSVGLGSPKMDGSVMFLGYTKDGKPYVEEVIGKKHSHSKVDKSKVVSFSVKEEKNQTHFEFSYPIKGGNITIDKINDVIWALSQADSTQIYHKARGNFRITLE